MGTNYCTKHIHTFAGVMPFSKNSVCYFSAVGKMELPSKMIGLWDRERNQEEIVGTVTHQRHVLINVIKWEVFSTPSFPLNK